MAGYSEYIRFQRIEEQAKLLGFRLAHSKSGSWGTNDYRGLVGLYPLDEKALPVYNRDAELFCGSFDQLESFLLGWAKAQQYDYFLKSCDNKRRKKFEQAERKRQEDARIKAEQQAMWKVLKEKTDEVQS